MIIDLQVNTFPHCCTGGLIVTKHLEDLNRDTGINVSPRDTKNIKVDGLKVSVVVCNFPCVTLIQI